MRWTLAILIFIFVSLYVTSMVVWNSVETAVIDGFSSEMAQMRFMSYATTVTPLRRLEVAKLDQVEVFDRSSEAKLFWQKLILPVVVVRATVPVEYRYYVELNEDWEVVLKGNELHIVAPALTPATPSPDVSSLQFEVRQGSFFRSEVKVARALRKELTRLLVQRAKESSGLVRETARGQIKILAEKWLTSEMQEAQIHVRFADETPIKP